MPKRSPGSSDADDDVNKRLGARLRNSRELAGLSQTDVGKALGVSFQQVQKYENGTTSISLNRLSDIASCFRIPINTLVEGLDGGMAFHGAAGFAEPSQMPYDAGPDPVFKPSPLSKDKVSLLNAFGRIQNAKVRRYLVSLVEALSDDDSDRDGEAAPRKR